VLFLQALDFIAKNYQDFGIRRVKRIPVSGAFHTMLMESARKPVRDALKTIEMQEPSITLYSDVTSSAVRNNYSWNRDIVNQIVKPVKWEQIMYKLYMREKEARHPYTYECGPGNQLGIFLQKLNNKAYKNYRKIEV
jgi:[acyl-carrier-protein] S-malonyltransferase